MWESAELTSFAADLTLPSNVATVSRTYRVRVRMKDATGRWSHWSQPVEFTPLQRSRRNAQQQFTLRSEGGAEAG